MPKYFGKDDCLLNNFDFFFNKRVFGKPKIESVFKDLKTIAFFLLYTIDISGMRVTLYHHLYLDLCNNC